MSIRKKANKAVTDLEQLLSQKWTEDQELSARKVIESAMVDAINEICEHSSQAVNICCSADQDMAHKINDELRRAKIALIANLSSMR